tara:strand:- start:115 stop:321 length:207 start_codon:yes stop_codon:yes gene_type:complete
MIKYNTTEYARRNRLKPQGLLKYQEYQKNYHKKRYNTDPEYQQKKRNLEKERYYYKTDPLPCIRKLWN